MFKEVEAPRFHDNRHMTAVKLSATCTGRIYPKEIFLVLVWRLSRTVGPQCGRKDYVNEEFQPSLFAKLLPEPLPQEEKRSESAADFSPPSRTVVRKAWSHAASHSSVK